MPNCECNLTSWGEVILAHAPGECEGSQVYRVERDMGKDGMVTINVCECCRLFSDKVLGRADGKPEEL